MSARLRIWLTAISLVIIASLAGLFSLPLPTQFPGHDFWNSLPNKLGLDLQGGAHLVYQADTSQIAAGSRQSAVEGVRDVIERRVNALGVAEPVVQTNLAANDSYRVIVELAGVFDIAEAIRQIGETPLLEFKELSEEAATAETATTTVAVAWTNTELTGKYLKSSGLDFDQNTGEAIVRLDFDATGAKLFEEISARNVGQPVAIFLDGTPISIPVVQQTISGGQAIITGQFNVREAKQLAQRLNAGALPVPISLISEQTVGPSLGEKSLAASLRAGLLGLILVVIFMIVYYRLPGLLAVLALGTYMALVLLIFKLLGVTLTLAGIAGFILTLGMAVDANVLIFERLKEELKAGNNLSDAITAGFARAWTSIRDSNLSSLITAIILYWFGSSFIKGFAITFAIGILLSMFSALVITKTFLRVFERSSKLKLFTANLKPS